MVFDRQIVRVPPPQHGGTTVKHIHMTDPLDLVIFMSGAVHPSTLSVSRLEEHK